MEDNLNLGDLDLDLNLADLDLDAPRKPQKVGAMEAGIDKMLASQSQSAAQLAKQVGFEGAAKGLSDYSDEKYAEYLKFNPKVASYKDINTLGDVVSYAGENILLGSPELAAMFFGKLGFAANMIGYIGDTINEQKAKGQEVDVSRAILTAGGESLLNLPLTKGAKGILKGLDGTSLTEEAKKSILVDYVKNQATDAGTNGLQQVIRNYGVEGELSLEGIDEAAVGGMIQSAPIRMVQAVTDKATQQQLADAGSDEAVKTGDMPKADGFVQNALNFTVGTALRPIRRTMETEAGSELHTRIEQMRTDRELMSAGYNERIEKLFSGVKDAEDLRVRYSNGDRSTPELQELSSIMSEIHERANMETGANLKTGTILNYTPTHIDAKDFTRDSQAALAHDYKMWYSAQEEKANLVSPEDAVKRIESFAFKLEHGDETPNKMPRATKNENGDIVAAGRVSTDTPLKAGQLERSRELGFIPQSIVNDYALQRNFKEQMLAYAQSAAQRVTYAEQLGKNNEILNGLLSASNAQLGKTNGLSRIELDGVYNAMDAYQGTYGQFQQESARKAASMARSVSNVVALPLTALSSLTEPFNLAIKVGNVNAGKAFVKALGSMTQDLISHTFKFVPPSEVNKQLSLTGRSFKDATTALNNRINGEFLSPAQQNFNNAFFHATGQTAINYLVNSMAVHAMKGQVRNDLQIVNGANPNSRAYQMAKGRLAEVGVNENRAKQLHTNRKLLREAEPAMVARFNRDVALNPEALDKPVWMSTGWGSLFSQLRGYPTMFTNTVLPKLGQLVVPTAGMSTAEYAVRMSSFVATSGMILGIGFLQESLKEEVKGNGTSTDEELLMKAYRNTLQPIQAGYMIDAAQGNLSRVIAPVSGGVFDNSVSFLWKAAQGEASIEEAPLLKSFGGLSE